MAAPTGRRFVAGFLSMVLPGAGQLYVGARRRGFVLLGVTGAVLLVALVLASWISADAFCGRRPAAGCDHARVDLALLAFRLFAVVDASRGSWRARAAARRARRALTAAPHVAAGYLTVRGYSVLETVFADEEPCGRLRPGSVLFLARASCRCRSWVSEGSPGSWRSSSGSARGGARRSRLDARVLADEKPAQDEAVDDDPPARHRRGPRQLGRAHRHDHPRRDPARHGARRGLRNPAQPRAGAARRRLRSRSFKEPLNALYGFARAAGSSREARSRPTALKQAVSSLLGDPRRLLRDGQPASASPISSTRSEASRSR